MEQKRRLAIFDVDGTIFRSSLFIQLTEALIDAGLFPQEARRAYEREHKKWLEREGDYQAYVDAMVRTFRKHLKGVAYAEFADIAEQVVDTQWKRVYQYTRDMLTDLAERDYYLLAISHSPKTILDFFCPRLGFHKVYGTVFALGPHDRFTGEVVDEHIIANKANIIKRVIEKETFSLTHSIGVGDTESDIPFLEMVQTPICFNPNQKLYRHARRNEWKVVVERKDVVYDIN